MENWLKYHNAHRTLQTLFYSAIGDGALDVCKYLYQQMNGRVSEDLNNPLISAVHSRHYNICEWLVSIMDEHDILSSRSHLLAAAIKAD